VGRNDSFPFLLRNGENAEQYFEHGLGMAKWYFTHREYRRALEELAEEHQAGDALGRIDDGEQFRHRVRGCDGRLPFKFKCRIYFGRVP
jgi:hypothetical protein